LRTKGEVQSTVLDNGVRVLSEELDQFRSATVGIWVENGSRYETAPENGISHFLEHVFFKGTKRRSARKIAEEIEAVGGILNAFTGRELTCYYARVLGTDLPLALDVLGDVFCESTFPPDEIERERTVILSEIAESEDSPDQQAQQLFDNALWPGHALSRPICGTPETVSGMQRDDFLKFIADRYRADRIVVAAAGSLEHDRLVDWASEALSGLAGVTEPPVLTVPHTATGLHVHQRELEQVQMLLGVPGLSSLDERRFAAFVLNTAFGEGMSSRLFQEVREKRGKAYSIYSFLDSTLNAGSVGVYAALGADAVGEVVGVVRDEMLSLRDKGLEEGEFLRAKTQIKGSILLNLESCVSRMRRVAVNEIQLGRTLPIDEIGQRIDAVTQDDIRDLAGELFGSQDLLVSLLGKVPEGAVSDASMRLT
jgi:predicted Zn-dependent peptidase